MVYPEYDQISDIIEDDGRIKKQISDLWNKLPAFRDNMGSVPTVHVPMEQKLITRCLNNSGFSVATSCEPKIYIYRS